MAAYPIELRKRVIEKLGEGYTQDEIAEALAVSKGWVNKIVQCFNTHGLLVPPRKKTGKNPKLDDEHRALLRQWLDQHPELTLRKMADLMTERLGLPVNITNVFDALKAMGYSHKKNDRARRTTSSRCGPGASGVAENHGGDSCPSPGVP